MKFPVTEEKLTRYHEVQNNLLDEFHILNLQKISSGWETEVYSYDVKSEQKIKKQILRTFPGKNGEKKAVFEFTLMKNLRKKDYPVPKVQDLITSNQVLGAPVIIMERLTGGTLWAAMEATTGKEKRLLWSLFTRCFVRLHELEWNDVVPDPTQFAYGDPLESIEKPLQSEKRTLAEHKLEEFVEVVEWLEDQLNIVQIEQLSLVHFDYHPENIVLSAKRRPFVIDWSVARVTDYRVDLGWTLLCESTYGPRELRNTILKEYQQIRKSTVKNIEFFEVVAALRRLRVMAIALTGKDNVVGSRPEVDAILKGDTKHVEGVIDILKDRTGISLNSFEILIRDASVSKR
ncbi:MAG: phosphotransferase family protein [Candidatus Kariarchaeaceae archaeon]|jgi:aminoglycoside phosphotransferase (APT) family kinase protein